MKKLFDTYKQHYKALLLLGLPIVVGQLGVIVLGFADTLMIGHHSTEELGAASFVNNLFTLCIIFSTGFSYGLTPVVGGFYGNRRFAEAGQALRCSLVANVLVALLLTLVMAVLYFNVERLGQPGELLPLIKPYYLVLLASLVFVMLFNGFKQFTDGITDTKTAMWILLGGNALNIVGNYILINGKLGFPEMGLLGAGISTLFSRIVMVVVFAAIVLRGRRFIRYRLGFMRLGWSMPMFRKLNALGWPVGMQMGMETASFSLSVVMVGWLGDTCPSIASDNAYYLSVHLHDVLWHGRCGCRACQQLQGAGRRAECAPLGVCRPSHHPVYGGGVAGYRLCTSRSGRGMVYGQCGSVWHGCRSLLPVLDLPVRRWVAD